MPAQYKFQILDYLIHGNDNVIDRSVSYTSEYEAFAFLANIIITLELDDGFNYTKLNSNQVYYKDAVKSLHEALRTDYRMSYVPGTLEGFPKRIRINSMANSNSVVRI